MSCARMTGEDNIETVQVQSVFASRLRSGTSLLDIYISGILNFWCEPVNVQMIGTKEYATMRAGLRRGVTAIKGLPESIMSKRSQTNALMLKDN
jgi:hypothetical protein